MTTLLTGPPAIRQAMRYGIGVDRVRKLIDKRNNEYAEGVMARTLRVFGKHKLDSEPWQKNNKKNSGGGISPKYCPT